MVSVAFTSFKTPIRLLQKFENVSIGEDAGIRRVNCSFRPIPIKYSLCFHCISYIVVFVITPEAFKFEFGSPLFHYFLLIAN